MGEARRRKLLDPNYGKEKFFEITKSDDKIYKIREKRFEGIIDKKGDDYEILINCTEAEMRYLQIPLNEFLEDIFEFYGNRNQRYSFWFDSRHFSTKNVGSIGVMPESWTKDGLNHIIKVIGINLKAVLCDGKPKVTHESPQEHIRRAHRRRVAYGKGRLLRKWIDIPETLVNAR